jgi:diaminopimelate epimerase
VVIRVKKALGNRKWASIGELVNQWLLTVIRKCALNTYIGGRKMAANFYKYHALGNDYIVIDPNKMNIDLNKENIKLICHRNFGVGSDGILFGPVYQGESVCLRIFNPDGSEAEKSGNGIRIFTKYLIDQGYMHNNQFNIQTMGGKVSVEVLDSKANRIKVNMGKVSFDSVAIPVSGEKREVINEKIILNGAEYKVTCLSIGNPHCVIPLDKISKDLALKLGPEVENHHLFPNRINMQLLRVIDPNNIQIEIWERGAGYTLASGSSSSAAANAAYKLGLVNNQIKVHMPGGQIDIEIMGNGDTLMTGSVNGIASGDFAEDLWEKLK